MNALANPNENIELAIFGVHKPFGASLWNLLFVGIRSAQSSLLTLL